MAGRWWKRQARPDGVLSLLCRLSVVGIFLVLVVGSAYLLSPECRTVWDKTSAGYVAEYELRYAGVLTRPDNESQTRIPFKEVLSYTSEKMGSRNGTDEYRVMVCWKDGCRPFENVTKIEASSASILVAFRPSYTLEMKNVTKPRLAWLLGGS